MSAEAGQSEQNPIEIASKLTWISFYEKFADKLLGYQDSRPELIQILVEAYEEIGIKFPTLDSQTPPSDIDPFTVFGLFNKGITDSNRLLIMNKLRDSLSVLAPTPTDFEGVPVLNNQNATFYRFSGDSARGDHDIDRLWAMFAAALGYADNQTPETKHAFIEAFDAVKELKGNRWKLTMGLYWVRPYSYLTLDSRNRWFIGKDSDLPSSIKSTINGLKDNVPDGSSYLSICHMVQTELGKEKQLFTDFPELSFYAWNVSEAVNAQNRAAKEEIETDATLADSEIRKTRYWVYSPGEDASNWEADLGAGQMSISWYEVGDLSDYPSKEAIRERMVAVYNGDSSYTSSAHMVWQFANEMQPGDVVFAKKGTGTIIARGIVGSDYHFESSGGGIYPSIRDVTWTNVGSWDSPRRLPMKTLTDITPDVRLIEELELLFDPKPIEPKGDYPPYTPADFLDDVYMGPHDYETLEYLLDTKKNIILEGAPGVGKTYLAKRLAYSIMGEKNADRVMMLQFHQSYAYEDFIEGYRPRETGFELRKGPFYKFCKQAEIDSENDYFVIIDEINRGNLSKIFGELFMLIEADKREVPLNLLYSEENFSVPRNIRIIGMMNTADRGLAILDYALRRRFAFYTVQPGFDSDGFKDYQSKLSSSEFDKLVNVVTSLNQEIKKDEALGEGFVIGHSYLCELKPDTVSPERLSRIVDFELIPLLKEYWFDEPEKVSDWTSRLRAAIK